jgi:histidinol phosphatase-like PHP family hydrolase
MIQKAIGRGLDGLAITDHGKLVPAERLRELNEQFHPFRVFSGIEITLDVSKYAFDFVVIGLHDKRLEIPWPPWSEEKIELLLREGKQVHPSDVRRFTYTDLRTFVRKRGGFLILAHPFRFGDDWPEEMDRLPPDALEIRSTNIPDSEAPHIQALAKAWDRLVIAVSDAHKSEDVGCHAIRLGIPVRSDKELVAQLRKGAFSLALDRNASGRDPI